MEDICANRHGGAETSVAANKTVDKETDRLKILGLIKQYPIFGYTLDELSMKMGRSPNQLSGRLTELRMRGLIWISHTRKTRTGRRARVYLAT